MSTTMAWGRWDCTRCGHQNITGRDKRCPACGDPRASRTSSTRCIHPDDCGNHQRRHLGPRGAGDGERGGRLDLWVLRRQQPERRDAVRGLRGRAQAGDRDGQGRPGRRRGRGALPGAAAVPAPPRTSAPAEAHEPKRRKRRYTHRQIALGVLGVLFVLLWWSCRATVEETGVVARLQWTHTTELQRWHNTNSGAWAPVHDRAEVPPRGGRGEVPGVRVGGCYQKHSHDERYSCGTKSYQQSESYSCGSRQVCSNRNNGNGSFSRSCRSESKTCRRNVTKTRTKYCSRPIYRSWCDFVTQTWTTQRSAEVAGEGHENLRYAIPTSGDLSAVQLSGRYSVSFAWDDGEALHIAEVERAAYDDWQLDDPVVLQVERVRGVVGFARAQRP